MAVVVMESWTEVLLKTGRLHGRCIIIKTFARRITACTFRDLRGEEWGDVKAMKNACLWLYSVFSHHYHIIIHIGVGVSITT